MFDNNALEPRTANNHTKETSSMSAPIIEFDDMQAGMDVARLCPCDYLLFG